MIKRHFYIERLISDDYHINVIEICGLPSDVQLV